MLFLEIWQRIGQVTVLNLLFVLVLASPVSSQAVVPQDVEKMLRESAARLGADDPAAAFLESVASSVRHEGASTGLAKHLDRVVTLEHDIPIAPGRSMRVEEHFTLRAWLRRPHRGFLMISSSAFNRRAFSTPVEGYNATEMFAKKGMFVLTLDYLGVGDSYRPSNGRTVTREDNIAAMSRVMQFFRIARQIPKVDILGEGYGSTLAPYLAADSSSVRTLVMCATIYKSLTDGPLSDPAFVDAIVKAEDGYLFIPPEVYDGVMPRTPPDVLQHQRTTQSGFYPVAFLPAAADLPFFDPGVARAPGLIIYGRDDTFAGPGDPEALAADYGTNGAELVFLEGAGHAPRIEDPETAGKFWAEVIRFVEP